jgi:ABC-type antimicrobial peptide transport system permease subunit
MNTEQTGKLLKKLQHLDGTVEKLNKQHSLKSNIFAGLIRGAATIVGAVLFVIVAGWLLKVLGVIPGTEDLTKILQDSFYQLPG